MNSFDKRIKRERKKRYKFLKKMFKARDMASPYIDKVVKVRDVVYDTEMFLRRYDIETTSIDRIAKRIVDTNGALITNRPPPPPPRNGLPSIKPLSGLESANRQLRQEGYTSEEVRDALKALVDETAQQPVITGDLGEYLDKLEEKEMTRLAKGEVTIRRKELLETFGLPDNVEIASVVNHGDELVITIFSAEEVSIDGVKITYEATDDYTLRRKVVLRNPHKPMGEEHKW